MKKWAKSAFCGKGVISLGKEKLMMGADAAGMNRATGRAPGPEGLGDWSGRGGPRPRHGSSRRAGSRTAWLGTARSGRIPAQRSRRRTAARVPGSSACQHSGDRLPAGQGRPGRRGAARRRRRQPPTRPRPLQHDSVFVTAARIGPTPDSARSETEAPGRRLPIHQGPAARRPGGLRRRVGSAANGFAHPRSDSD